MLGGKTIGFLGAGNMTEAMVRGLLDRGVVSPQQLLLTNHGNRERLSDLSRRYGVRTSHIKAEVVDHSDIIVAACKPKDAPGLMAEIGPRLRSGQVLLSVMAGISTAFLQSQAPAGVQVVRAMPNTSSLIGESATGMSLGAGTGPEAGGLCQAILGAVGTVVEVPEAMLDAVTGLSGTGPAYIYLMVEALIEAGKGVGIPADVARTLVMQTIKGAAQMLNETGEDPAVLRQKVTSPNGTTMAAMQVLGEAGFTQAMARAVARATQRSRELGAAASTPKRATG